MANTAAKIYVAIDIHSSVKGQWLGSVVQMDKYTTVLKAFDTVGAGERFPLRKKIMKRWLHLLPPIYAKG